MNNTAENNSRVSISFELLRYISLYYLTVAIILTFIQVFFEYKDIKSTIDNNISDLFSSFDNSLTNSIWEFNETQTRTILQGINKSPLVLGVKLINPSGKIIYNINDDEMSFYKTQNNELGILNPHHIFNYTHKLYKKTDTDQNEHVGNLIVYSGNKVILDNLSSTILYILISSFIKTISLLIILFIFLRKNINIPLSSLIEKIRKIDPQNPKEIQLNHSNSETQEIHQIVGSFNSLITELVKFKEILQAIVNNTTEQLKEKSNEVRDLVGRLQAARDQEFNQEKIKRFNILTTKMSEELSEPLDGIKNSVSKIQDFVFKEKKDISPEVLEVLNNLLSDSKVLNNKIQTLKNDSDNNEIIMSSVNLKDFIEIYFNSKGIASSTSIEHLNFDLNIQDNLNLYIFKSEFQRLLKILFEYAVTSLEKKLKSEVNNDFNPQISISARKAVDNKILMTIHDNGLGISNKIESNNSKKQSDNNIDFPDKDLHLYLANEIVKKHEGELLINCEKGVYTEVQIYIPI